MRRWFPLITIPLFAACALMAAFAWIEHLGSDQVGSWVDLDGRPVGELTADELENAVGAIATAIEQTPVSIRFAGRAIETTGVRVGVMLDRGATVDAVMAIGREGDFLERFGSWLTTVVVSRQVDSVWSVDPGVAKAFLDADERTSVSVPVEPSIELAAGRFETIAGVEGLEVDRKQTADLIASSFRPGATVVVDAPTVSLKPIMGNVEAVAFADRLNSTTDGGIAAMVGSQQGRLSQETLRSVVVIQGWPEDPSFSFDAGLLRERLFRLFADVTEPGSDPVLEIRDGEPTLVEPGTPPRGCCDPAAGDLIVQAIESDSPEPVVIPTVAAPNAARWSTGEEVTDLVGEFTTMHQCCENRVSNIHRIADLVRGVYLTPGERFSVNEFVGERTTEKGFVSAGVIEQGRFAESVGGGISQFATTFFNAAFFAGLELEEYQSHSIYISRYPYGREATLSFPKPDLVIRNTTDFPVLIWSSYDDTSITISLYSTPNVEVEQTRQVERPARKCTQVETFRNRTYSDGRVVEDSVTALYRPAEGFDCNGNPTPEQD